METKLLLLWIWVIFNIFIGLYEIHCYYHRHLLDLDNIPVWNSSIIASWNEYCRVDARYVFKEYVWNFELLNAFYAFLLVFILLFYKNAIAIIPYILLLEILSCSLYFLTLGYEFLTDDMIYQKMLEKSTMRDRVLYYGMSSIWIFVPIYLYSIYS
jgi:hypothetical protein